ASLPRRRARSPAAGEFDDGPDLRVGARRDGSGCRRRPHAPLLALKKGEEVIMDLVLKLREIRRMKNLSQKDVARLSGVGEKTISSFETGQRIGSLKLAQLRRLLGVYGLTEADFFGGMVEKQIAPWELEPEQMATVRLLDDLHALPQPAQRN